MSDDRAELAFRTALATRAGAYQPETREPPTPHRRRRWPAVLAAAVLVVGIVLVGAFRPHAHQEVPSPTGLPDGWRWESHANVMVAVPDTWGYAAAPGSDWCAATGSKKTVPEQGYVDTRPPGGAVLDILCGGTPPSSLTAPHLTFSDSLGGEIPLPAGWVRVRRTVSDVHLTVTRDAGHRALADQILATAHTVGTDLNGCAATSPIQDQLVGRPTPPFDVASLHHVASIAVCQYQLDVTGPGLVASRLLTGDDADAELAALQDAATKSGPDRGHGCSAADRGETGVTLLLSTGGQTHEMYAFYSGCTRNGFDDGTDVRELTTANCRPLFDSRIIDTEGIRPAFERCTPARGH
ncbi:MAG TPA: hypothetical protein VH085_13450 [Nocardioides sp.]|nr:hypothetical protein [Nocardioides sp.]